MTVNIDNNTPSQNGEIHTSFSVDSAKRVEVSRTDNAENLKTVEKQEKYANKSNGSSDNNVKTQLKEWTERMNRVVKENVRFNFNEELGSIYVTVVNSKTNEVIRTIPSEDALKLSAIWKDTVGNIFDKRG